MKLNIILFIVIFIGYLSILSPAWAKIGEGEELPAQKESISDTDIPNLTIDPSKEIPQYLLSPMPTPTPPQNEAEKHDKRAWTKSEFNSVISEVAKRYNLDPQLIYATIMTESEGNIYAFRYEPDIKDASFCAGQILLNTARSLGFEGQPKELYKPETCIDLVGKYYRRMLDTYGKLTPLQLATAYNAGSPWKSAVYGHLVRFSYWYDGEVESKGS